MRCTARPILLSGLVGLVVFVVMGLALVGSAYADSIVVPASRDTTVYSGDASSFANGGGEGIFAGLNGLDQMQRSLLTFELPALPAGAVLQSVTLTLHMEKAAVASEEAQIAIHRLLTDWGEGRSRGSKGRGRRCPGCGRRRDMDGLTVRHRALADSRR